MSGTVAGSAAIHVSTRDAAAKDCGCNALPGGAEPSGWLPAGSDRGVAPATYPAEDVPNGLGDGEGPAAALVGRAAHAGSKPLQRPHEHPRSSAAHYRR